MRTTMVPNLGREISLVGLGTWQLGGDWATVGDDAAQEVLAAAADAGTRLFDTADVYGDGRSEKAIGRFLAGRADRADFTVITKMGRRAEPHEPAAYTLDAFRAWTDRSRENLGVETLDLVQLHCPPTAVYGDERVYDDLRTLQAEGRIARWGVSVELVDEALAALEQPDLATIQIIVNIFRRKPLERVLPLAAERGVGIIARLPLASGLLSGKYDEHTTFAPEDHRTWNRDGSKMNIGETFSGIPFEVGVAAAREVAALTPAGWTTAQMALGWLAQVGVATMIPGASRPSQAVSNAAAAEMPALPEETMRALEDIYDRHCRRHVHDVF
ncbi:aldo/keto reductase [Demequina sp. SYSU T00039]|uniref:Aldo/keto reductase n=1 Tax=Demequina lignilytica TaxID=3051663 RepID=A0AAW7M182_9MICO|nr:MULTISPECIES: aldo/keto reductase [unclassified Demequina]MDN4477515.1 aldo/keto reductase [Demequina sp. SYSU T00039-1]MDN4488134.1 aldo/keto reductase [Demequina sp. SYSU T00039]MDN4490575.1 aldo/keto reductase [Demequina sp. SYSU T00068]